MDKKYRVILAEGERASLGRQIAAGSAPAHDILHARILLKADEGPSGPAWIDATIAAALETSNSTVERVRRRFATEGLEVALNRRPPRREYRRKLDGEQEAHLIALACGAPPDGHARWTLRLLADRMVQLQEMGTLSYQTVRRALKRNELKPWLRKQWVIPPRASAEFVWRMEDVLEVYTRPYDPNRLLKNPCQSGNGVSAGGGRGTREPLKCPAASESRRSLPPSGAFWARFAVDRPRSAWWIRLPP